MASVEPPPPPSPPSPPPSHSSSPPTKNPPLKHTEHYSIEQALKSLEQTTPLIQQAIQQAHLAAQTADETVESAIAAARSRLSQIRSTSSAHFHQFLESVKEFKASYDVYEAQFFGKIKEGASVAVSNPMVSASAAVGLGVLALKGPRRFLYYRTLRLFSSEEAMVSRADAKVKELRQSYERLKAEAEKLEKKASQAEDEMKRGRTKLRHAGNEIRKVLLTADKIEKQARGLKGILGDLSNREASVFRSQVSNLVADAKRERKLLSKEVNKISNYGISI